jgi:hypothetical protein
MKAKFSLALTLFSAIFISGCQSLGHLYPVQGPLASLTPPPIYAAKFTLVANFSKPVTVGAHSNDRQGKLAITLANGEQFQGTWKQVYEKAGTDSAPAGATGANSMAAAWDTVYGQGFYVAHVLGQPLFVHTELTGNQGTMLQVEWYDLGNENNNGAAGYGARGVAQDSKGNIYKLVM